MSDKPIIDVCCGGKMFWFDTDRWDVIFMDNRAEEHTLCDGRTFRVDPDIIGDFRNIPFPDNTFSVAVFDPPHLIQAGEDSWLAKKYGRLEESWRDDIRKGFSECLRVVEPGGLVIFKWSDTQVTTGDVLAVIDHKPLFGNRRGNGIFLVFRKDVGE